MESATRRIALLNSHLCSEITVDQCSSSLSISETASCPVSGKCGSSKSTENTRPPIRVCVTGAAGNIGYSLVYMIANGDMFGSIPVALRLLDIPQMVEVLKGVEMELIDGAYPLLKEVLCTSDVKAAFLNVDVVIMVGAFPRQKGMERKDLLKKNAAIFKEQGRALNDYASRNVKVLVVGNPANTNCMIAVENAPELPKQNFTCLTRLDHNRAKAQIANRLRVAVEDVQNVIIWGNHSSTQYPDASHAYVENFPRKGFQTPVKSAINDDNWLQTEFISTVQQRGGEIIKVRKASSAASAARAVVCHMRDWLFGTCEGEIVSMGVYSDGSYGVPKDIIYSFPVTCHNGSWSIVQGLPLSEFSKQKMQITANELLDEKREAFEFLK